MCRLFINADLLLLMRNLSVSLTLVEFIYLIMKQLVQLQMSALKPIGLEFQLSPNIN